MEGFSYWEQKTFLSSWDVIVVGSGITGLSAAIHLKEVKPNLKVLVLERGHLPQGASTKNAGFACFGSISELIDDEEANGIDQVVDLVEKRIMGLEYLKARFGVSGLSYEEFGSYEIFGEDDDETYQKCKDQVLKYNQIMRSIVGPNTFTLADDDIENFGFKKVKHLIKNQYEGQLDSGHMMMALITLAQHLGVHIYDGLGLISYEESSAEIKLTCDHGYSFKTERMVVATNGFAAELVEEDVQPARAQVLITEPIHNLNVKGCFHYDRGYYYFRNIDGRILLGGGRNLDMKRETTTVMKTSKRIQDALDRLLKEIILPDTDYQVAYRWSGIMGVGASKKPIIKRISKRVYCGVRLGGMGVAIGSHVGQDVAGLVLQDQDENLW